MENLFSMDGKVCLVTGGSSGLGSYMAHGFLVAGAARVYITARSYEKLNAKADELSSLGAGECIPISGDLSSLEGINSLVSKIKETEPYIDVLVNNACQTVRRFVFRRPFASLLDGVAVCRGDGVPVRSTPPPRHRRDLSAQAGEVLCDARRGRAAHEPDGRHGYE